MVHLTKREARRLVEKWVTAISGEHPGYHGCFLSGSVNSLADNDIIPDNSDIDLTIVIDETVEAIGRVPKREYYHGVLLEPAFCPKSWFDDRDGILREPNFACHLAADCIVDDKDHYLRELHRYIQPRYGLPESAEARCRRLSQRLQESGIALMTDSDSEAMRVIGHTLTVSGLGQIILLANLQIPTYRKCLIRCRDYLKQRGRIGLYDRILRLLVGPHITAEEVGALYRNVLALYHKALETKREPFFGDFYIYPEFADLVTRTADEFIKGGDSIEGVMWMLDIQAASLLAIEQGVEDRDKYEARAVFQGNLCRIGIRDRADYQAKATEARSILDELLNLAIDIIYKRETGIPSRGL
jgi:hypothetical protein